MVNYSEQNKLRLEKYKQKDLATINSSIFSRHENIKVVDFYQKKKLHIIFDDFAPVIRFKIKEEFASSVLKVEILKSIVDFASKNQFFENGFSGSHVCMKMDGCSGGFEAFVRIKADIFFLMHPRMIFFLKNFEKFDDFFET